jgi:hypothetical protein
MDPDLSYFYPDYKLDNAAQGEKAGLNPASGAAKPSVKLHFKVNWF